MKKLVILLALFGVVSSQTDITTLRNNYVAQNYGLFVCFNLISWQDKELGDTTFPASRFNPSSLNAGQWARIAETAGMKYAVLTTKHHDGFCLWDAVGTTYDVASSPWKSGAGDVVKEFVDSCRVRGIAPVLYFSVWDMKHNDNTDTTFVKNQITQLLTNYGPIPALWLDGWEWAVGYTNCPYKTLYNHIKSLQPNCLVIENNHYFTQDSTDIVEYERHFDGVVANNSLPKELCETIRTDNKWFWGPGYDVVKTPVYLALSKQTMNSRNSSFLVAVQPDTTGLIPGIQDTALLRTAKVNKYTTLADSLTGPTTLTAGVYYMASAVQTKNYPLYFDLRYGNIVIHPALGTPYTFLHNGSAVCSTYTGVGKLIFTSANDTTESYTRILDATGTCDSSNVVYPYIYSTGTGSVYLYDVKCKYNNTVNGILSYSNTTDALTKNFVIDRATLQHCSVPPSGSISSLVGLYTNEQTKLNSVIIRNVSIDSTNSFSSPGQAAIIYAGPANAVEVSGCYINKLGGTGSAAAIRTTHVTSNATFKNNLFVTSATNRVGYLPLIYSGACTLNVSNNTMYSASRYGGSAGLYAYEVSGDGVVRYKNNCIVGFEVGCNSRNMVVTHTKDVYYNCGVNVTGVGNTLDAGSWTTTDPAFTKLVALPRIRAVNKIPDGWAIGASTIKKHGDGTFTTNSIAQEYTFDGYPPVLSDTVTAGVFYDSRTTDMRAAARAKSITLGTMGERKYFADTVTYAPYLNFINENFDKVAIGSYTQTTWTGRNVYNWAHIDSAVNWCVAHGKKIHVNTLLWYSKVPTWLSSGGYSDSLCRVMMTEWITAAVTRYTGRIQEWEVINEACSTSTSAYQLSNWWEVHCGPHHWEYAYKAARAADPSAILYYNDYDVEYTDDKNGKGNNLYKLCQLMKTDNTPVDVIGLQSHFTQHTNDVVRNATVGKQVARIKALGYDVAITEMDYAIPTPCADTVAALKRQAQQYAAFIKQAIDAGIKNITIWGWDDSTSWINRDKPPAGSLGLPCMYSKWDGLAFPPKPAYYSVLKVLTDSNATSVLPANSVLIQLNPTCVSTRIDSMPLIYDLHNITSKLVWSKFKADGSNIYLTDSAGREIKTVLTGFNKTEKMGQLHFNTTVDTVAYKYYVKHDANRVTRQDSMAVRDGGIVFEPDYSAISTVIPDIAKRVVIDSVSRTGFTREVSPFGYAAHVTGSSFALSKSNQDALKLTSGSISTTFYSDTAGARTLMTLYSSTLAYRMQLYQNSSNNGVINIVPRINGTSTFRAPIGSASTNDSAWHYINISWDAEKWTMSLDGRNRVDTLGNYAMVYPANAYINLFSNVYNGEQYRGLSNFTRVHGTVKSRAFTDIEYQNVMDPAFWSTQAPASSGARKYISYKRIWNGLN
jgi:GH35 family endo-1,4-beta-xylanase/alpha-L-fucosidase